MKIALTLLGIVQENALLFAVTLITALFLILAASLIKKLMNNNRAKQAIEKPSYDTVTIKPSGEIVLSKHEATYNVHRYTTNEDFSTFERPHQMSVEELWKP